MRKLLVLVWIFCSLSPSLYSQPPATITDAQLDAMIAEVSNWGRWGKDDQLGTINLITPAKRKEAAGLVREGISVSLSRDLDKTNAVDNGNPFGHSMLSVGRGSNGQWAMDQYTIAYHGVAHTHMDSLCHLFYKGKMYNGFSRDEVTQTGAGKLAVVNFKQGIVSRGLLVDIPRLRGVRFLEPGTAIMPSDLDAWEKSTGLKVTSGDILLIHTGRWIRRETTGGWDPDKAGLAGLHASCSRWLKQRDIAIMGTDGAGDVIPSGAASTHPIHVLVLYAMGCPFFDNCDFTALAETAARLNRWEFMVTAGPLAVPNGTGSPLNPIATF